MIVRLLLALSLLIASQSAFAQWCPAASCQVYGQNAVRYFGTGANDEDLVVTAQNTVQFDHCMLMSATGTVDVEVTIDGTTWTTAALSLQDLGATSSDPVLITAALRMYAVNGRYLGIRLRQEGAAAAAASLLCWKK